MFKDSGEYLNMIQENIRWRNADIKMETINELEGKIFMTSSACMSVWADGLSWANANPERITKNPAQADNLVVLSCQVTDLAVLNDFRTLEKYQKIFPNKKYFVSGCLAKREDIEIPAFANRLETPRDNFQFLFDKTLVNFEKPFWVQGFREDGDNKEQGHLFRSMYPLRIGKGCPNKCTYCTIRKTRGQFEQYDADRLEREFLAFEDVILIADNPLANQIKDWRQIAERNNKPISIRNVEPSTVIECTEDLESLAKKGLLKVFHSPIQSCTSRVLADMGRKVERTFETMEVASRLKQKGVYIATNIIIDYKDFKQNFTPVYQLYDYVSWNPLWNGIWNRSQAEARFKYYIESGLEPKEVREAKLLAGVK
jgi:tRNA A37 methylthiotransferase MiaB